MYQSSRAYLQAHIPTKQKSAWRQESEAERLRWPHRLDLWACQWTYRQPELGSKALQMGSRRAEIAPSNEVYLGPETVGAVTQPAVWSIFSRYQRLATREMPAISGKNMTLLEHCQIMLWAVKVLLYSWTHCESSPWSRLYNKFPLACKAITQLPTLTDSQTVRKSVEEREDFGGADGGLFLRSIFFAHSAYLSSWQCHVGKHDRSKQDCRLILMNNGIIKGSQAKHWEDIEHPAQ